MQRGKRALGHPPNGRSVAVPVPHPHRARASGRTRQQDAIALLKADHRQVEEWFSQFEKTQLLVPQAGPGAEDLRGPEGRTPTIEEEIFYPAFLEATERRGHPSRGRGRARTAPRS